MAFWGVEVKPGKPYTHIHDEDRGRLRVTQATLGSEVGKGGKGGGRSLVQCSVGDNIPVLLCSLIPERSETCHLELEFEEDEDVVFLVLGPRGVHLSGFYLGPSGYDRDEVAGMFGDEIRESDTDSEDLENSDSEDDEYDSDFIDDNDDMEMIPSSPGRKSSVIIEEIPEDDEPDNGEQQKGSKKHQTSDNDGNSQNQLAAWTLPSESLESEDEDGFPVSFSESKSTAKNSYNKNRNPSDDTSNEDRKRKNDAVNTDSSRQVNGENDRTLKRKKKTKNKKPGEMEPSIVSEKVNSEEKESRQKNFPVGQVDSSPETKQEKKKRKNKNESASEVDTEQHADKKNIINNHAEETNASETKKKKKKNKNKKALDNAVTENQAPESQNEKQPFQTRTFGNGLIIEEVAMGKPDGKKASRGSKVSVNYIGKLKNGKIFDSNVGKRPFEFRLGVGQVIKGWDIGVAGMRVGDKRRLTIPPSMGYGDQKVGKIPKNSTLVFDVELVNVK